MKRINFNKIKKTKEKKLKIREPKEKKTRVHNSNRFKLNGKKIWNFLLMAFIACAIMVLIAVIGFGIYIIRSAPEFDPDQLYEKEASILYDSENNIIATLGAEQREKISYNELPNVLVDAVIATEDSRFFQHNGFDLPRFLKASLGQLVGKSNAGGGSTITMQVSKNNFTGTIASGIKGIIRKFTDIYMSIFQIEKNYTKEEILEFYVNYPWLGSNSWGVEQASKTYFGKGVKDLTLPEAALIAGLFQAPGVYDPYVNPKAAESRRNQVLNLMVRHGYITQSECDNAKKVIVANMLVGNNNANLNKYQGFIDTVVRAIKKDLDVSPYDVPMEIHSTMVASKQNVINDLYNGKLGYKFKDDAVQLGVAVIDNKTGAIIAVGAGRNKTTERSFNYATQTKAHPGSTAKPIFDYGPGIEYLKWSTYTPFFDEVTKYSSGKSISNWDNKYKGMLSLSECLSESRNTCALQAFKKLDNAKVYNFVTSLGITPEGADEDNTFINEAHSIGGFTGVSPVTLAAAYSAFASGGYYTKPYSYTKIVYRETGEEIETSVKRTRVMSEQTAYMITKILFDVTPSSVKVSGTQIATKTGTSSYDKDFLKEKIGITTSIIRDSWVSSYSPDYTLTFWYGYDDITKEAVKAKHYNTMNSASSQRRIIQGKLANLIMEKNSKFKSPKGLSTVKVEFGTIPAQLPSENTPSNLIKSYIFISGTEPTEVSSRFSDLANPTKMTISENLTNVHAEWNSPGTPSAIDKDYLQNYFNNSYGDYADKYYKNRLSYNDKYIGKFGFDIYLVKGSNLTLVGWTDNTSYDIDLSKYSTTFDSVMVKSAYSIFKSNRSSGITQNLSTYSSTKTIDIDMFSVSLHLNESWSGGKDKSSIESVKVDGTTTVYELISMSISEIKKDDVIIALGNITKNSGVYTVKYDITIKISGIEYTKKATQTVTVSS